MTKERVAFYVDGFNLYHAIDALGRPHLKWVDLHRLARHLLRSREQRITKVLYCSALAVHFTNTENHAKLHRHLAYCAALRAKGVVCSMGKFAKRDMVFKTERYKAVWRRREEKQTDVRIAVSILEDAYEDVYDTAYVVSGDSDLVPLFERIRTRFPAKRIVTVAPLGRKHNDELLAIANTHAVIKQTQIEKALFGRVVVRGGTVVARRPREYDPPARP